MERRSRFFHGSKRPLRVGTVLHPRGMPDFEREERAVERALEAARPEGRLPRSRAVFLTTSPDRDHIEKMGGSGAYIYEVEPIGALDHGDVHVWAQLYHLSFDYLAGNVPKSEMLALARTYWSAPVKNTTEYLASAAKVVAPR